MQCSGRVKLFLQLNSCQFLFTFALLVLVDSLFGFLGTILGLRASFSLGHTGCTGRRLGATACRWCHLSFLHFFLFLCFFFHDLAISVDTPCTWEVSWTSFWNPFAGQRLAAESLFRWLPSLTRHRRLESGAGRQDHLQAPNPLHLWGCRNPLHPRWANPLHLLGCWWESASRGCS